MEVDEVDDCFLRGSFDFFVFTIPQTLFLFFILRLLFNCLFHHRISIWVRRYYFTGCAIVQTFLESSFAFFTYLFFSQMIISFSFNFTDKLILAGSILLYFVFLFFGISFYFLGNNRNGKSFGYFLYCYYRCFPALIFLTLKCGLRAFAIGAIHRLLHENYFIQIILLCVIEMIVITSAIILDKTSDIFLTKTMFCLTIFYHFSFIIFNLSLYFEYSYEG